MKNELRKIVLQKRKQLEIGIISKKVLENLFLLDEYINAKNILCYYPLRNEIQTLDCFKDMSKNWFLPRVSYENLEICSYKEDEIKLGSFNIKEPTNEKITDLSIIDMVIIPAVAVDKKGYRIGYGKGYYDRFLPLLSKNCKKVILVYSDFVYKTIYPDKYDVPSDILITDKEILRF